MAVLLDTGIVYAFYDRSDRWHGAAVELVRAEIGGLLVPSPAVAEIDHLLGVRLGSAARHQFYRGLSTANFLLLELAQDRVARVAAIDEQFSALELGFVDSAIVALVESTGVRRVGTSDRRHFEPLARAFGLELVPPPPGLEVVGPGEAASGNPKTGDRSKTSKSRPSRTRG